VSKKSEEKGQEGGGERREEQRGYNLSNGCLMKMTSVVSSHKGNTTGEGEERSLVTEGVRGRKTFHRHSNMKKEYLVVLVSWRMGYRVPWERYRQRNDRDHRSRSMGSCTNTSKWNMQPGHRERSEQFLQHQHHKEVRFREGLK
jgi:hypothetical protein